MSGRFIYKGLGGGLASDDLYLLDLKEGEEKAAWNIVPVVGPTPGRRYGHILVYAKPFLVVFGGNTGIRLYISPCLNLLL